MTAITNKFRLFSNSSDQIVAAYSDRRFDINNRNEFLKGLDLDASKLYIVKQVHGEHIIRITSETELTDQVMADGLVTDQRDIVLGVQTADCLPVFFWDPDKQVIGLVHAGWRGAHHKIASKMVAVFQQNFGSQVHEIKVGFGPCIRKSAYEVGEEFAEWFNGFYEAGPIEGKGHLDLPGFVRNDLIQAGILAQNIEDCGFCTYQEQDHFYSYRRENQTRDRILSVISMRTV